MKHTRVVRHHKPEIRTARVFAEAEAPDMGGGSMARLSSLPAGGALPVPSAL